MNFTDNNKTPAAASDEFKRSVFASSLYQAGALPVNNSREGDKSWPTRISSIDSTKLSSSTSSNLRQSGFFNASMPTAGVGYKIAPKATTATTTAPPPLKKILPLGPTGSWQHPSVQAARQNRFLINQELAVTKLVYNGLYWLALRLVILIANTPDKNWSLASLLQRYGLASTQSTDYYTTILTTGLQVLFAFNILSSIYWLTQNSESSRYSLKLSATQRKLLGLSPKPETNNDNNDNDSITPPKYLKSTPGLTDIKKTEPSAPSQAKSSNVVKSHHVGPLVGSVPIVPPRDKNISISVTEPTQVPKSSFVARGKYMYMTDSRVSNNPRN